MDPVVVELVGGWEDGLRFALPLGVEPPTHMELPRKAWLGPLKVLDQYEREKQDGPVVFYRWRGSKAVP